MNDVAAIGFDYVEVKTWRLPECRQIGGREFGARYAVPSPYPRWPATGDGRFHRSSSTTIHLWDTSFLEPETQLHGHLDHLYVVAYSPMAGRWPAARPTANSKLLALADAREGVHHFALGAGPGLLPVDLLADGTWLGAFR